MHVHVLIDSLTLGGAETLLADFTVGAQRAGIEVTVGYLDPRDEAAGALRRLGVEPTLIPITSLLGRRDRCAVRDHLAETDPDLLHTHLGYADFLGGLAARSLRVPAVSTLHVMEWDRSARELLKTRLMFWVRRHCMARVIMVSEAARHHYLDTGWDRPEHVTTVHNGIVAELEPGAGVGIREELDLAIDDMVVGMVSVLRPGKGHAVAAQAVASLRETTPKLRLLVLGDGPARAEIEKELEPAGDAVVMAGFRSDVLAILDGVDILLHPSRVDAFPTALLEAMAARVPVVATDVGGIPEIVVDGETGTLVPSPPTAESVAGALLPLLNDADLRARMGERARRVFEAEFTAARWMERLRPIYEDAVRRTGRARHT